MADTHHDFVIVIPVADRPRQLEACLASLAQLRRTYPYPGRVSVLVAEDSLMPENCHRHAALTRQFSRGGLTVHHLGQAEQASLLAGLGPELAPALAGVLGDGVHLARKGAAITRNLAYLWLARQPDHGRRRLYWFLDSDQEFRVSVATEGYATEGYATEGGVAEGVTEVYATEVGETLVYALDYFKELDRIFRTTPTRILTGKVVGDPPVSPAVMAATFLEDVLAFLEEMAALDPEAACTFHDPGQPADDAAYHDMADLFGFRGERPRFRFRCPLAGPHDHADCLAEFARRLPRFFQGEHPTRRSYHRPGDALASVQPARTIYTGNYVLGADALEWFVPFAQLKLRMAGPTLGRILKAELGPAFVSANLPMLHRRTEDHTGEAECRPGLEQRDEGVDLSDEFERQFHGDVMLFSVQRLWADGAPGADLSPDQVAETVAAVAAHLRDRYNQRQLRARALVGQLRGGLEAPGAWWQGATAGAGDRFAPVRTGFRQFLADMARHFDPEAPAWQRIDALSAGRQADIVTALLGHARTRSHWQAALARMRSTQS